MTQPTKIKVKNGRIENSHVTVVSPEGINRGRTLSRWNTDTGYWGETYCFVCSENFKILIFMLIEIEKHTFLF